MNEAEVNEVLRSEDDRQWVFVVLDEQNNPVLDENGEPVFRVVPKPGRVIAPPPVNVALTHSLRKTNGLAALSGGVVALAIEVVRALL